MSAPILCLCAGLLAGATLATAAPGIIGKLALACALAIIVLRAVEVAQ